MATWKKIIVSGSQAQLAGVTGSFTGSFKGDGSGLTGVVATNPTSLTQGEGISAFSYNGLTAQTVSVSGAADLTNNIVTKWDNTANKFTNSSLTDDGSTITGATSIQLTGASSRLTGSFTGSLTGIAATASYFNFGTINQNVVITGSLTVSGSATPELFILGDAQITGSLNINGGLTSTSQTSSGELVNGNLTVTGNTFLGDATTDRVNITGSFGVSGSTNLVGTVTVTGGLSATSLTGSITASSLQGDIILGTQTSGQYASTITGGAGLTATAANANDGTAYTIDAVAGAGISLTAPTNDAINIDTGSAHFTGGVKNKMNTDLVHSGSTWTSATNFTNTSNQFTGSFTGSFTGDGSNLTGIATTLDVSASNASGISINLKTQDLTITGTANEIETSAAGTTITIGLPNDVTVTNNLIIGGNFTVNGTTTFVNTNDLYVEDQFIVLASGSANNIDGGIAIDRGAYTSASVAYGYDSVTERWGFQNGLADTTNAIVISNPTASAFVNYAFTEATHGVRTGIAGEFLKLGSIYTDNTEDIWIFS